LHRASDDDAPKGKFVRVGTTNNFYVDHFSIRSYLGTFPAPSSASGRIHQAAKFLPDLQESEGCSIGRIQMTPKAKLYVSTIRTTSMLIIFPSKVIFSYFRPHLQPWVGTIRQNNSSGSYSIWKLRGIPDPIDPKIKVARLDDTNNFRVEHFSA